MLSLAKAQSREYLIDLARKNYYLEGGEPPGLWYGTGTEHLGLSGEVEKSDFKNLWAGRDPDGNKLVQNAGSASRQKAWDLVFSAPKSVSTVWAITEDPALRKAIEEAHLKAVHAALDYLQAEAGLTRTGKGGHTLEPAALTFAIFQHGTSRANEPEPQLHSHCELFNFGFREDGKSSALHTTVLYRHKMAAGALYQASFAQDMERLGFGIVQEKKWGFEIAGVPQELRDHFSTRSQEVEAAKRQKGLTSQKAGDIAALETRGQKDKDLSRAELFAHCGEVGKEFHFEQQHIEHLRPYRADVRNPQRAADRLAKAGVKELADHKTFLTERELTVYVAQKSPGTGAGPHEISQAVHTALTFKAVHIGEHRDERLYTTPEILQREQNMLDSAATLQARQGREVSTQTLDALFAKYDTLKPEQRGAIQYVTDHTLQLAIVSGVAGAGKGFLLGVAKEAFEQSGYTVVGLAPTGKARSGLSEEAGIKSWTIDKAIHEWETGNFQQPLTMAWQDKLALASGAGRHSPDRMTEKRLRYNEWQRERADLKLTARHVLVVDEAGMANVAQMERIFQEAQKAGAKVCLLGDADQLPPVRGAAPFRALAEKFDEYTLTEIVRQEKEWQRNAVHAMREGKAQDALSAYLEEGHFHLGSNREKTKEALVNTWHQAGDIQHSLILASTNAEVSDLNRMAQDKRVGELSEKSIKVGSERIHEGDRVLFTKNNAALGVANGAFGMVRNINKLTKSVTVELDSGKDVPFSIRKYDALQLGYAATVHKAQGMTTDRTYALLGETMQDRHLSYVQLSRHRHEAELFCDRETAGEKFGDLITRMEQEQERKLAVQLQDELQRETFLRELDKQAEEEERRAEGFEEKQREELNQQEMGR